MKKIKTALFPLLFLAGTYIASPVTTEVQKEIRPSYPFPDFLSTAPYEWYENADNQPIKGHTYRVVTFIENNEYQLSEFVLLVSPQLDIYFLCFLPVDT